jgi:hypothetical protein
VRQTIDFLLKLKRDAAAAKRWRTIRASTLGFRLIWHGD